MLLHTDYELEPIPLLHVSVPCCTVELFLGQPPTHPLLHHMLLAYSADVPVWLQSECPSPSPHSKVSLRVVQPPHLESSLLRSSQLASPCCCVEQPLPWLPVTRLGLLPGPRPSLVQRSAAPKHQTSGEIGSSEVLAREVDRIQGPRRMIHITNEFISENYLEVVVWCLLLKLSFKSISLSQSFSCCIFDIGQFVSQTFQCILSLHSTSSQLSFCFIGHGCNAQGPSPSTTNANTRLTHNSHVCHQFSEYWCSMSTASGSSTLSSESHTNHHRWFLQNMLNKHVVPKSKIIPLFMKSMLYSGFTIQGFDTWTPEAQYK
ncbi:hypothetical protein B566_EDAN017297, partial [Ephemera danica]